MAIEVQNRTHNNFLKTIEDKSKQKVTQFWDRQTVADSIKRANQVIMNFLVLGQPAKLRGREF